MDEKSDIIGSTYAQQLEAYQSYSQELIQQWCTTGKEREEDGSHIPRRASTAKPCAQPHVPDDALRSGANASSSQTAQTLRLIQPRPSRSLRLRPLSRDTARLLAPSVVHPSLPRIILRVLCAATRRTRHAVGHHRRMPDPRLDALRQPAHHKRGARRVRDLEEEGCISLGATRQEYNTCYNLVHDTLDHVKIKYAPETSESMRTSSFIHLNVDARPTSYTSSPVTCTPPHSLPMHAAPTHHRLTTRLHSARRLADDAAPDDAAPARPALDVARPADVAREALDRAGDEQHDAGQVLPLHDRLFARARELPRRDGDGPGRAARGHQHRLRRPQDGRRARRGQRRRVRRVAVAQGAPPPCTETQTERS
jgi:hypothetical protein